MIVLRDAFRFIHFHGKEFFGVFFLMMYIHIILDFFEEKFEGEIFSDIKHPRIHQIKNRIFHLAESVPDFPLIVRVKRLVSLQFFSDGISIVFLKNARSIMQHTAFMNFINIEGQQAICIVSLSMLLPFDFTSTL